MRSLVPLCLCAFVLAACGGGSGGGATTTNEQVSRATFAVGKLKPPAGCYVTVYMVENATGTQLRSMKRRLVGNRLVATVYYVSKELELRRFKKADPAAARLLAFNPFADRFEVVTHTHGAAFAIIGDLARHPGPITNAVPSKGCAGASLETP